MPPILRNILSVPISATVCISLNGILLGVMMKLIGTPEGFDRMTYRRFNSCRRSTSSPPSSRMRCPRSSVVPSLR